MPALAQQLAGDSLITYLQTQNSPISQTFSNSHRRNFTGKWKSEESHLAVAGVLLAKRKINGSDTDGDGCNLAGRSFAFAAVRSDFLRTFCQRVHPVQPFP